jgi:LysM repeat protein
MELILTEEYIMVSNMDTNDSGKVGENTQNQIIDQTKDEILDYLMGSASTNSEAANNKSFESLRKEIHNQQSKLAKQTKSSNKKEKQLTQAKKEAQPKAIQSLQKVFIHSIQLSYAQLKLAYNLASSLNQVELFRPVTSLIEKLHRTRIDLPQFSPEAAATLKAKVKPLEPAVHNAFNTTSDFLDTSKGLAKEYAMAAGSFMTHKLPAYRKTTAGALVLIGCGLLTLISQVTMQASTQRQDVLNSKRLASVNWNVNGHVSDKEKSNVKKLMANGNIKVVPKAKQLSNRVQLITDTAKISNKAVSPDDPIMVISSNSVKHKINSGESILSISQKYKVSISDLISANPEKDLINLKSGQDIAVPVTMDIKDAPARPSSLYSKIPRNLIASRSMSSTTDRNRQFAPGNGAMAWPVPSSRNISSRYGPRWGGFHPGIDITAPIGTPIIATKGGVVISSGWAGGYGKCIIVDHGNGISTRYAHASALLVNQGQHVQAGQVIARMGSTGWSTGSHLHYEVMVNGRHHNPINFF